MALVLVVALGAAAIAKLSTAAVARARVDADADVVALAAVVGGAEGGRRVAAANGVRVVQLDVDPSGRAEVQVCAGGHCGRSAAAPVGAELADPRPGAVPR